MSRRNSSLALLFATLCAMGAHAQTPTYANVSYVADGSVKHKLDVYIPVGVAAHAPCVMWMHGGGWNSGQKGGAAVNLDTLYAQGYVIADINYRLSQDSVFPAQIRDCKTAVRFLKANADLFHIDTCRFGASGISAGAHLAALLGTSSGVTAWEGTDLGSAGPSSRVQAVLDMYGPTDFSMLDANVPSTPPDSCTAWLVHDGPGALETQLLGCQVSTCPARAQEANPIAYITADDAAFSICHGTFDCYVAPIASQLLYDALQAAQVPAQLQWVLHAGHGGVEFRTPAIKAASLAFFDTAMADPCSITTEAQAVFRIGRNRIFPNPATESVTIAPTDGPLLREIVIRDALGKVVWRTQAQGSVVVDVRMLSPGCYDVQQSGAVEKLVVLGAH